MNSKKIYPFSVMMKSEFIVQLENLTNSNKMEALIYFGNKDLEVKNRLSVSQQLKDEILNSDFDSAEIFSNTLEKCLEDQNEEIQMESSVLLGYLMVKDFLTFQNILKFKKPKFNFISLKFYLIERKDTIPNIVLNSVSSYLESLRDSKELSFIVDCLEILAKKEPNYFSIKCKDITTSLVKIFMKGDEKYAIESFTQLKDVLIQNSDQTINLLEKLILEMKNETKSFGCFIAISRALGSYIEYPTKKLLEKLCLTLKTLNLNFIWSYLKEYIDLLLEEVKQINFTNQFLDIFQYHFLNEKFELPKDFSDVFLKFKFSKVEILEPLFNSIAYYVITQQETSPEILIHFSKIYNHYLKIFQKDMLLIMLDPVPDYPNLDDCKTFTWFDQTKEMKILFNLNMIILAIEEDFKLLSLLFQNFKRWISLSIYAPIHYSIFIDKLLEIYEKNNLKDEDGNILNSFLMVLEGYPTLEIKISILNWFEHINVHSRSYEFSKVLNQMYHDDDTQLREKVIHCCGILLQFETTVPLLELLFAGLDDMDPKVQKTAENALKENIPKILSKNIWEEFKLSRVNENLDSITISNKFDQSHLQILFNQFKGENEISHKECLEKLYKLCHQSDPIYSLDILEQWISLEISNYFIQNRLKVFGNPMKTFEELEDILQYNNPSSRLYSQFILELERRINILIDKQEGYSPAIVSFFITNKNVCEDWFQRLKKEMINHLTDDRATLIATILERIYDPTNIENNMILLSKNLLEIGDSDHIEGLMSWMENIKIKGDKDVFNKEYIKDVLSSILLTSKGRFEEAFSIIDEKKLDSIKPFVKEKSELKFDFFKDLRNIEHASDFELSVNLIHLSRKEDKIDYIKDDIPKLMYLNKLEKESEEIILQKCKIQNKLKNIQTLETLIDKITNPNLKLFNQAKLEMLKDEEKGIGMICKNFEKFKNNAQVLLFLEKWVSKDSEARSDLVQAFLGIKENVKEYILELSKDLSNESLFNYGVWISQQKNEKNSKIAMECFFKSLKMSNKSNVMITLNLLNLFSDENKDYILNEISNINSYAWLDIIPQIFANLNNNEKILKELILKIGKEYPEFILYPLLVSKKEDLINQYRKENDLLVNEGEIFINEISRITTLWEELCLQNMRRKKDNFWIKSSIGQILNKIPETKHEYEFQEKYEDILMSLINQYDQNIIEKLLKKFKSLGELKLSEISKLKNTKFEKIPIPGLEHQGVYIQDFEEHIEILNSKTKPKKIIIKGTDGKKYVFLIKGQEDLHLDERMMQLLKIINRSLKESRARYYHVTPFERSGLIRWVKDTVPLFSIYKDWFSKKEKNLKPIDQFYKKLIPLLNERGIKLGSSGYPKDILKQVLKELMSESPKDIISKEIWYKSKNNADWWEKTKTYIKSVGVMSMIGYIIGLGDRHLDNILLDENTFEVIHIDYNICFEKGKELRIPEVVPFRLTPIIYHAFGVTGEGSFKITCQNTFKKLKKEKDTLLLLLETFINDPIIDWSKRDQTPMIIARLKEIEDTTKSIFDNIKKFNQINIKLIKEFKKKYPNPDEYQSIESPSIYLSQLHDQQERFMKIYETHKQLFQTILKTDDPNILKYSNIIKNYENYLEKDKSFIWNSIIQKIIDHPNDIDLILTEFEEDFTLNDIHEKFFYFKQLEKDLKDLNENSKKNLEMNGIQLSKKLKQLSECNIKQDTIIDYFLSQGMKEIDQDQDESLESKRYESEIYQLVSIIGIFRQISRLNSNYQSLLNHLENVLQNLIDLLRNYDYNEFESKMKIEKMERNEEYIKTFIHKEIFEKIINVKPKNVKLDSKSQNIIDEILFIQKGIELDQFEFVISQKEIQESIEIVLKQLIDISWNYETLFEEYEKKYGIQPYKSLHLKKEILSSLENYPLIIQFEEFRSNNESIQVLQNHIKNVFKKYKKSLEKVEYDKEFNEYQIMTQKMNEFKQSNEFIKYFELLSEFESLIFTKMIIQHKKDLLEYIKFENEKFNLKEEVEMIEKEIEKIMDGTYDFQEQGRKEQESILKRVEYKLDQDISKIDHLISQAKSIDHLAQMYEGWMPWI